MTATAGHPGRMTLDRLLEGFARDPVPACEVAGLACDSRTLAAGDVFLACAGRQLHGAAFAAAAVRAGAAAIVWEPAPGVSPPEPSGVPVVAVPGLANQLGAIADRYYDAPSARMAVSGVTGTNGKTSCAFLAAVALGQCGWRCGLIGTLGAGFPGALTGGELTTPDALHVHRRLDEMAEQGARAAVLEVSSHALDQGRVNAVRFDTAVFTNLSRDHLDYHGSFDAYAAAKTRLFLDFAPRHAVINVSDGFGRELAARLPAAVDLVAVSHDGGADTGRGASLTASSVETGPAGLRIRFDGSWGPGALESSMLGRFNASNLLAVLAMLLIAQVPLERALEALASAPAPPGRMQRFGGSGSAPTVIVDYAHTPDALEKALLALREHCRGELWCVFGCGGERDPGKRPLMGAVAAELADRIVLTDDNPRGEDPAGIVAAVLAGMPDPRRARVEHDRRAAIAMAVRGARAGDVVLVAGKGHEAFQTRAGQRLPFSDAREVRALLEAVP